MKTLSPFLLFALTSSSFSAEPSTAVTFGGFIDTYYAYDLNHPPTRDRAFTTQSVRNDEFNINLAYIEAKLDRENIHGRFALQTGTSVQSNYAGEPSIGSISGPSLSRQMQEAYGGYRLGRDTWLDAGIMLSHIGVESFISKDNLLYTRSLVAEYSPYYETGIRLTSKLSDSISAQILVLNGWQNISENNSQKALGTQLGFVATPQFTLMYNTFFDREAAFRQLHDFILKYIPNDVWTLQLQADVGHQDSSKNTPDSQWHGFTLMAKRSLSASTSLNGRIERFADENQILTSINTTTPFRAWGASLGFDNRLDAAAWWRTEIRTYRSDSDLFPDRNGYRKDNTAFVSSLSLAF